MFQLNDLAPLVKKRKRVGRGGSRGGTSGKGHKGQKARTSGTVSPAFEGGQMPISRRLPKRGFNNKNFKKRFEIVSLAQLEKSFNDGENIIKETLVERGIIKGKSNTLLKVLGGFNLTKKLIVSADAFSKSAIESINKVGGKAETTV
jgi:large subunit ribosomal protein L15